MSFQLFFESISVREFLEIRWKRVPSLWSGVRETSLTKLEFQFWGFVSKTVGGTKSSMTG